VSQVRVLPGPPQLDGRFRWSEAGFRRSREPAHVGGRWRKETETYLSFASLVSFASLSGDNVSDPASPTEGSGGPDRANVSTFPRTPAMTASVADHVWTLEEIAGLLG
jgi:hypothetical protein